MTSAAKPPIALQVPPTRTTAETGFLQLGRYPRAGRELTVNSRWIERDGQPWMPVMGEFHYSRYPESEWRTELQKMAAGGIDIVATYVFWNHHEEVQGQFDWLGQRNLRRFVELAAETGLLFYLRPGPWVHAEARLGGLPDWLVAEGPVRNNDAGYLRHVERFFGEIATQLRGLMWCDGGPVIGLQIENEYDQVGPGRGAEHITALQQIAIEKGLTVPLYTVTGWPTLDIPERDVIPVSGAYADGFWGGSAEPLPPSGVFLFDTSRAIGEMGNVGGTPAAGRIDKSHYPFFLAEAGGGMHVSYHRRPAVTTDDVAATALVQVGSGANLYGYYMYHGGANPAAIVPGATLNETQATGYPNDVPVIGYDFRAPLGQYGQVRPSYGRLRCLHQFMAAFGTDVAAMDAVLPDDRAPSPEDRTKLRVALRGAGDEAFLFVNNHVRHHPMPDFAGVQFDVVTSRGTVRLPAAPATVRTGAYFIWPVGLRLGAARLAHATVQPLTRWTDGRRQVFVAFALPGIDSTLCFDTAGVQAIGLPAAQVRRTDDGWFVTAEPGQAPLVFTVTDADGVVHTVVLLSQDQADQCLHTRTLGRDRLLISDQPLHLDGTDAVLSVPNDRRGSVQVFPADDLPGGGTGFLSIDAGVAPVYLDPVGVEVLRMNAEPPAVQWGPVVSWRGKSTPLAPDDTAYDSATRLRLTIPDTAPTGPDRVVLTLDYVGDTARLYADGKLVDDHFHDGEPWYIGIDRFAADGRWPRFELAILAADPSAPIFLEDKARARLHRTPVPTLLSVRLQAWRTHRVPFGPSQL